MLGRIISFFLLTILITFCRAADETYAYVCLSLAENHPSELKGKNNTVHEVEFTEEVQPASGKYVNLHIVANTDCRALVAAFRKKDGQLAHSWRPLWVSLAAWEESKLPKAPISWNWTQPDGAFDLHIVLFNTRFKEAERVEKLVAALQKLPVDPQTLLLQAHQLSLLINEWSGGKLRLASDIKTEYARLGGVERGTEQDSFQWRQFSKKISFSQGHPGVLAYSWNIKGTSGNYDGLRCREFFAMAKARSQGDIRSDLALRSQRRLWQKGAQPMGRHAFGYLAVLLAPLQPAVEDARSLGPIRGHKRACPPE